MLDSMLSNANIEAYVNVSLIVGLLAVGALIKHLKIAENISNKLIPIILTVLAVAFCISMGDNSTVSDVANNILSGIINAASAVGTHQLGKNTIMERLNILNILGIPSNNTTNDEEDTDI